MNKLGIYKISCKMFKNSLISYMENCQCQCLTFSSSFVEKIFPAVTHYEDQ